MQWIYGNVCHFAKLRCNTGKLIYCSKNCPKNDVKTLSVSILEKKNYVSSPSDRLMLSAPIVFTYSRIQPYCNRIWSLVKCGLQERWTWSHIKLTRSGTVVKPARKKTKTRKRLSSGSILGNSGVKTCDLITASTLLPLLSAAGLSMCDLCYHQALKG